MRQPDHLQRIIKEVRKAVQIPLTIKVRAGWDEGSRNAIAIAHMAESEGVEALAIHGRTRAQLYRGSADWDLVEHVAEKVSIPVLGSGDVVDRASAEARLRGKIAGLFIGRASMWNPLVFSEIMAGTADTIRNDHARMVSILFRYIELLREDFQESSCAGKVKQLASQMCRGAQWRKNLLTLNTLQEQVDLLNAVRDGAFVPGGKVYNEALAEGHESSSDVFSAV
jgi:tRNA-dihydrouridine synthase